MSVTDDPAAQDEDAGWLVTPPSQPADPEVRVVILAHGAGAAMDTPFLETFAVGLAAAGWLVVRFEFPYMASRRGADGKRRPPDRQPALLDCWRQTIAAVRARWQPRHLVLAGKSMGGRMASLIADEQQVDALVVLGYPFHPAGKPEALEGRCQHLGALQTPALICQGTRDALGGYQTVAPLALSSSIVIHWLEDGDHSFKPRRASGRSEVQAFDEAITAMTGFLQSLA